MRVALFATYGQLTPHLGTDLELAERHLLAGDEVTWVRCDEAFEVCEANLPHARKYCHRCRRRIDRGIELLSGPVRELALADLAPAGLDAELDALPTRHTDLDALKAFRVDGFDAGWAAMSSTIWAARDPEIPLDSEELWHFLRAGVRAYRSTLELLKGGEYDRLYVFNGRMAPMRGALRAAQELGVHCVVHERGCDVNHFGLFDNCMPHDITPTVARVHAAWEASDAPVEERERIGRDWFERRAKGFGGSWKSFTAGQTNDALPADWSAERHNIVFYTSSEHEFAAIGNEWAGGLFASPTEAAIAVAKGVSERGIAHLTIRIHPNPDGAQSSSVERMLALDLPHVTVVAPDEDVSTYALMAAADVVVTSGSTAGIEAVYRERPSINVGTGLAFGLGAQAEPRTTDALWALLADRNLPLGSVELAIQYGHYQATFGQPFEHFQPDGLFRGTFKGDPIQGPGGAKALEPLLRVVDLVAPRRGRVRFKPGRSRGAERRPKGVPS